MKRQRRLLWVGALAGLFALLGGWGEQARAQDNYPSRAIDIIVPFDPGGSTDNFARTTAAYVSEKWGVPINVINKPGARGIPQTLELYSAAPDGYTLFAENPTTNTMLAGAMGDDLPFDIFDRTFLAMVSGTPFTVLVAPDSPYKTLEQLLKDAKEHPEKISYTSQGSTGTPDYFIRVLFDKIGADISKAPAVMVTGAAPTIPMTAGGHVVMGLSSASGALAAVKGGLVRALVISSKERHPDFPGVPTTVELGYPVVISWNGLSGPPNMPQEIVEKWEGVLQEATNDPKFIANLAKIGAIPYFQDSKDMEEYVRNEIDQVAKMFGTASN